MSSTTGGCHTRLVQSNPRWSTVNWPAASRPVTTISTRTTGCSFTRNSPCRSQSWVPVDMVVEPSTSQDSASMRNSSADWEPPRVAV